VDLQLFRLAPQEEINAAYWELLLAYRGAAPIYAPDPAAGGTEAIPLSGCRQPRLAPRGEQEPLYRKGECVGGTVSETKEEPDAGQVSRERVAMKLTGHKTEAVYRRMPSPTPWQKASRSWRGCTRPGMASRGRWFRSGRLWLVSA
jgi:hypothetical protein